MRNFDVYFEIYGRKMKAVIMAENEEKAKDALKEKIRFHKIVKSKDEFNLCIDIINDAIDILKNV